MDEFLAVHATPGHAHEGGQAYRSAAEAAAPPAGAAADEDAAVAIAKARAAPARPRGGAARVALGVRGERTSARVAQALVWAASASVLVKAACMTGVHLRACASGACHPPGVARGAARVGGCAGRRPAPPRGCSRSRAAPTRLDACRRDIRA